MNMAAEISSDEIKCMRKDFTKELKIYYSQRQGKPEWNKKRIADVMKKIEEPPMGGIWYYYQSKYEVKVVNGEKVLSNKNNKHLNTIIKIVPSEKYFDIILEAHMKTNHGGRDKIVSFLKDSIYIPSTIIALFPKHCKVCKYKNVAKKIRNIRSTNTGLYKRGLLHIVNMTNNPCESFNYILYYQDQHTKFCFLRALTTDSPDEIALELTKIFLELGRPTILASTKKNREFVTAVVAAINICNPENHMVAGNFVDGSERDSCIKRMVEKWMSQRKSKRWTLGIHFVQFDLNCTFDEELDISPYTSMFGFPPRMGIDMTDIPIEITKKMKHEKDLREWQLYVNKLCNRKKNEKMLNSNSEDGQSTSKDEKSVAADNDTTTDIWCWVCEKEDDSVTFLCSSCNGAIHKTCGKYNNDSKTVITCSLCLKQEQTVEIIEIKKEPDDIDVKSETIMEVPNTSFEESIKQEQDSEMETIENDEL